MNLTYRRAVQTRVSSLLTDADVSDLRRILGPRIAPASDRPLTRGV